MLTELIKLATDLDRLGLAKEADYLDRIISRAATTRSPADTDFDVTQLVPGLTPIVTAVVTPIVGDVVEKISQQVYDECFEGFSNKARVFMNGGPTEKDTACITEKATKAAIAELSNPANIAKAVGAAAGALTGGPALGSGGILPSPGGAGLGDIVDTATGVLGGALPEFPSGLQ
jgi:hypothetical protein